MKTRHYTSSAFATLALGAALALATTPAAQAMSNEQNANMNETSASTQAQQGSFRLADAESLMDAKIESQDGKEIGSVKYLMIDPADGSVLLALVQKPNVPDKFIAVPWRKLDVAHWQSAQNGSSSKPLELMAPANVTDNANTYSIEDVARLSTPIAQAKMYNVYGIPVPGSQSSQSDQSNQSGATNGQAMKSESANEEANESARAEANEESNQSARTDQNESNGAANGQSDQQAQNFHPTLFVGHEFVGMVTSPAVTLDNKLKGSEVIGQNGDKIGTIKTIVIDLDHGQVAYTLISAEQHLGIGGEKVPVPMAALEWSGQGAYQLKKSDKSDLQGATEDMSDQSLPATVDSAKLDKLYQRFDATPYWQQD